MTAPHSWSSTSTRRDRLTIGEAIRWLVPSLQGQSLLSGPGATKLLAWPPDVFAVAGSLLSRSGAYSHVLHHWPPGRQRPGEWGRAIYRTGDAWRRLAPDGPAPPTVRKLWALVAKAAQAPLNTALRQPALTEALIRLLALSDHAASGAGVTRVGDRFLRQAVRTLVLKEHPSAGASLGRMVHASRLCVLPKMHTPPSGLTLRSLSHNLAIFDPGEAHPDWWFFPYSQESWRAEQNWYVLLVPWPLRLRAADFQPVVTSRKMMPKGFGFFTVRSPRSRGSVAATVARLLAKAKRLGPRVDCVVLPEFAVNMNEYDSIARLVLAQDAMLIAGVGSSGREGAPGTNTVRTTVPFGEHSFSFEQHKHHRWRVEASQISQYNLPNLDSSAVWWEHILQRERRLQFLAIQPWLVLSVLICEDLARIDPVGQLLRAVGPNLVISLLMDGPQLTTRWPARYATVLADDPGSAVLTVTSLGMALLSQPKGKKPSRAIALWKEPGGRARSIKLPVGREAALLKLTIRQREEWTADGRSDGGVSGYPSLRTIRYL